MADEWEKASAARWRDLTIRYSCGRASSAIFEGLIRRYASPDRHYHTLRHIMEVLDLLDRHGGSGPEHDAALFAAWFHDVIYDTRAEDNEQRSGVMARRAMAKLDAPEELAAAVEALILATSHHDPAGLGEEGELFLDADLAILGAGEDRYREYAEDVRREYAWVPEEEFRAGRMKVLKSFLERDRIYRTEPIFSRFEPAARRNIRNEIERLRGF